jgi:alpha-galactosidase
MRHDLEIPEKHGIKQSVGDSVGPGGVMRALRNIPVLVGIAEDMAEICPDAWMLNITNPMTTLCRAVTRATDVSPTPRHEIAGAQWMLPTPRRRLPCDRLRRGRRQPSAHHHRARIDGEDALPRLRELLADPKLLDALIHLPPGLDPELLKLAGEFLEAQPSSTRTA